RIGVMTNLYGSAERHRAVNDVMTAAAAKMHSLGATIVRFELPEYDRLEPAVATSSFEARSVMERYLSALGPNAPVKTIAQLLAAKTSAVQQVLDAELGMSDGMNSPTYKERTLNREKLRIAVAAKMAELNVDAILYPLQK